MATQLITDSWRMYATMFEDHLESVNAAPGTITIYGVAIKQLGAFLADRGMPADPTLVTREHLVEWMRHMQREKPAGQGLTPQTALQRYRSASRLFAWLVDTDEIPESPMAKMKPPRVAEKMVPVIKQGDLDRLFKAMSGGEFEDRRDRAIASLFIDCGPRIGELAGVRMADLDLEAREIVITGKGSRTRRVRFVRETRTDLQRYILKRQQHADAESDWLWLGRRGPLTKSGIYRMVVRRCEQAEIPPIHPHLFRHTFAHQYLAAGGNEGDLMKVTGWKSRAMVDRYGSSVAAERAADKHDAFSPRKNLPSR